MVIKYSEVKSNEAWYDAVSEVLSFYLLKYKAVDHVVAGFVKSAQAISMKEFV